MAPHLTQSQSHNLYLLLCNQTVMLLLMHLIKPGTIEESKTYIRRVTTRQVTLVSLQKSDGIVVFNSVSIFFFPQAFGDFRV